MQEEKHTQCQDQRPKEIKIQLAEVFKMWKFICSSKKEEDKKIIRMLELGQSTDKRIIIPIYKGILDYIKRFMDDLSQNSQSDIVLERRGKELKRVKANYQKVVLHSYEEKVKPRTNKVVFKKD